MRAVPSTYLQEEWVNALRSCEVTGHLPVAIDIEGKVDQSELIQVLHTVIARHETLRAALQITGESVSQVIAPRLRPDLRIMNLMDHRRSARNRALERWALREADRPIDLRRPPLWRGWLARLAPDHHVLVFVVAHVIWDEGSTDALFADLVRMYRAHVWSSAAIARPSQLADYAVMQRQHVMATSSRAHWRTTLSAPLPNLPLGDADTGGDQWLTGHALAGLTRAQSNALSEIAANRRANLASALGAVVLASLWPYLSDEGAVIGRVYSHRLSATAGIVGLLADTLPVRVRLSGQPAFAELIGRLHRAGRAARRHEAPAALIQRCASGPVKGRLWDINVNYMPPRDSSPEVVATSRGELKFTVRTIPTHGLTPKVGRWYSGGVPLGYNLRGDGGGVTGNLWARSPALTDAAARRLVARFDATVGRVLAEPHRPIRELAD